MGLTGLCGRYTAALIFRWLLINRRYPQGLSTIGSSSLPADGFSIVFLARTSTQRIVLIYLPARQGSWVKLDTHSGNNRNGVAFTRAY